MLDPTGYTYVVWLADLSDRMDGTRLPCGAPIVPGDFVVWRMAEDTLVPIQAFGDESEANHLAEGLNYE